jgi:hypothetical protein
MERLRDTYEVRERENREFTETLRVDHRLREDAQREDFRKIELALLDRIMTKERVAPVSLSTHPPKPAPVEEVRTIMDEAFQEDEIAEEIERFGYDYNRARQIVLQRHQPLTNAPTQTAQAHST